MSNLIKIELDEVSKQRIENLESMILEVSSILKKADNDPEKFLGTKEVIEMVCFSETTLNDKIKAGLFPAPVSIFTRNRWKFSEVKKWMDEQWQSGKKY